MKDDHPERGDILLGAAILAGTMIPAMMLATLVDVGDTAATRLVLYGGALSAAVVIYRNLIKPLLLAVKVILGLDQRVGRIEEHLGIPNDDAQHRANRRSA